MLGRRAVGGWWHLSLSRWPQGLPTCPPSQCHLPGELLSSRPGAQPPHRRARTLFTLPRGPHKPRCPCKPAVLSTPGPGVFTRPQVLIFTLYRRVTRSQPAKSSAGLSHVSVDLHGHPVQDRDPPATQPVKPHPREQSFCKCRHWHRRFVLPDLELHKVEPHGTTCSLHGGRQWSPPLIFRP